MSHAERQRLVDQDSQEVTISQQVELLGLSRSGVYYKPVEVSELEIKVKHRIDEIYTTLPFYGSPKITKQLNLEGWVVNHKRIERYMAPKRATLREMGLAAIRPGPNLSKRREGDRTWPYLLRGLDVVRNNQVFGIDITYLRPKMGWMYLVAVLDWYSRYVVAWELDDTLEMP